MEYSIEIKNERMNIVKNHIDDGILQIYTENYNKLLVKIKLENPSAKIEDGILKLINVPFSGVAIADGIAKLANIIEKDNIIAIKDLSVGLKDTNLIIDNINIEIDQIVRLNSGMIIHA